MLGFLAGEENLAPSGDVAGSGTTTYSNPVAKQNTSGGVPDANHRPFRSASNAGNVGGSVPNSPPPPPNV